MHRLGGTGIRGSSQTRPSSLVGLGLLTLAFLTGALLSSPVLALDPGRAITQYARSVWGVEEGLPANYVWRVCQGADGYIWVFTTGGPASW
jgi:ligand-binding sensor domain-containing protein